MRGFNVVGLLLTLSVLLAGCGGDGDDETTDEESPGTTAPATTTPVATTGAAAGPATELTLRIADVRLINSEESDNGVRILLPAGVATASVTLTGVPTPNRVISVCQARDLDRRLTGATCRTPANGETVTVTLGSAAVGVEVVQVGVAGPGPDGNSAALDEVVVRYTAPSREINVRLPQIAADTGGRPTFSMTPPSSDGAYRAVLTWTVIPVFGGTPANGQLELLRDGTPTQNASSGAEVRLSGNVSPPTGNLALRISNLGTSALVAPKLSLLLP